MLTLQLLHGVAILVYTCMYRCGLSCNKKQVGAHVYVVVGPITLSMQSHLICVSYLVIREYHLAWLCHEQLLL